ncbi:hypothetical protein BDQ17DRAFT_1387854 [Cyathus striatus]|nr:hypothetical protein BDQ17DRAFT_1387854 [Cyathus striatus]
MSEYWVSKKKYFCKYCDIYIADDAPSRQQHENGLRHKGNLERYIRGIYKAGEKRKKDLDEERREMARVERAAQAAFSQDVSAGHATLTSASSEPSASTPARKPPPKPSNPYSNYTTAESLGYTDPDAERLAAEAEMRRSQGVAGEWHVITPPPGASTSKSGTPQPEGHNVGEGADVAAVGMKREAEAPPVEEDARTFKLRKKTIAPGLGDIYDPGLIPIKLRKKEEPTDTPSIQPECPAAPSSLSSTQQDVELPKWTTIQLRSIPLGTEEKGKEKDSEAGDAASSGSTFGSKWTKVQWGAPQEAKEAKKEKAPGSLGVSSQAEGSKEVKMEGTDGAMEVKEGDNDAVKKEEDISPPLPPPESEAGGGGALFRKRKAPAGTGRGRRQI